jgi:glycosyltransferase involved in cell wall biosynthesis
MKPTAIIITYNEEKIIAENLQVLTKLAERIIIIDSYSTDSTCEIARKFGAEIFSRRFDDYASQRKYALALVENGGWVLMLDADEILSKELVSEISNLSLETENVGYFMKRIDVFCGRKLKYASENLSFPRLFRVDKIIISRAVNEQYEFIGPTGNLVGELLHYSFNKGIQDWLHKHVRYAYMEANLIEVSSKSLSFRQGIKRLVYRSRLKMLVLFFYYFIARGGILDGKRGILYIFLKLSYERNINLIKWYEELN